MVFDTGASAVSIALADLDVTGTLCSSDRWDAEQGVCKPMEVAECGFCRYMKAGPCGAQFQRWEDCVAACKDKEQDFFEHCGQHTWELKTCVDEHPEYYGFLEEAQREVNEEKEREELEALEAQDEDAA